MIPSTLKELARITALEELVDTANRLLHEQGCELETLETRIMELANTLDYKANSVDDALKAITGALAENARLRALLNAQDEYAYEDNGYVRLDTREDFHKVIGDGDG